MTIDNSFITPAASNNNSWIVRPSGSDVKDSDNIQSVLNQASTKYASSLIPADIFLAAGTFFCRYPLVALDLHGIARGATGVNPTILVAGTQSGGPMDFFSSPGYARDASLPTTNDAIRFQVTGIPDLWMTSQTLTGAQTNFALSHLVMQTNPATNANVGLQYFESPWDNMACQSFVYRKAAVDLYRTGFVTSVSAPAGGTNKQTLVGLAGNPAFTIADVNRRIQVNVNPPTITLPAGASIVNHDTVTVSDGVTSVVFEWVSSGSPGGGHVGITFVGTETADQVLALFVTALEAQGSVLNLTYVQNSPSLNLQGGAKAGYTKYSLATSNGTAFVISPADPLNYGEFIITDFVSAISVKYVNAAGSSNASVFGRWSIVRPADLGGVAQPLTVLRNDLAIDSCKFIGHLSVLPGDPYSGDPTSNVDLAIYSDDEMVADMFTNGNTPNGIGGTLGIEFEKAVLPSGATYYTNFTHGVVAGTVTLTNCTFVACGLPWALGATWSDPQGFALTIPSTPHKPVHKLTNNTITDCGFDAFFGSSPLVALDNLQDTVLIQFNRVSTTISTNQTANAFGFAIVEDGAESGPFCPGTFLMGNDLVVVGRKSNPLVLIGQNSTQYAAPGAGNAVPNIGGVTVKGILANNGRDPLGAFADCAITENQFFGPQNQVINLDAVSHVLVRQNNFGPGGQANPEDIAVILCYDVKIENNTYCPDSAFAVTLDAGTRYCEVIDQTGTLLGVEDSGTCNRVRGMSVTTP